MNVATSQNAGAWQSGEEREQKLELRVWLRLLACSTLIEGEVRSRLREQFATTLPRFDFLAQLYRSDGGLTMGELSNRLMVSNGNVTGLADRLEQEGLISRTKSANDRRSQLVALKPAGRKAFEAMTPEHAGWIDELFAGLDGQDLAQLLSLLGKLKGSLKTHLPGDGE